MPAVPIWTAYLQYPAKMQASVRCLDQPVRKKYSGGTLEGEMDHVRDIYHESDHPNELTEEHLSQARRSPNSEQYPKRNYLILIS